MRASLGQNTTFPSPYEYGLPRHSNKTCSQDTSHLTAYKAQLRCLHFPMVLNCTESRNLTVFVGCGQRSQFQAVIRSAASTASPWAGCPSSRLEHDLDFLCNFGRLRWQLTRSSLETNFLAAAATENRQGPCTCSAWLSSACDSLLCQKCRGGFCQAAPVSPLAS